MFFDRVDNGFTVPQIQYTIQEFEIRLEGEVGLFYIDGYGRAFQAGNRSAEKIMVAI
jgi:hypothetical protein